MNDSQLASMQQMLGACLDPDNAARKAAEASITQHLNEHRDVFIFGLTKLIRAAPAQEVRVLCAIIMRQVLPAGETPYFNKLPETLQQGIQTELLGAITAEPVRYVRSQISDTVASLASVLLFQDKWPGLFPALYAMCDPAQSNEGLKVCALSILGKLSDAGDNIDKQEESLFRVFQSTLAPPNSLTVRAESGAACCKVIGVLEDQFTGEYRKLIPLLLQTLSDALAADDEDAAKKILAGLTEVASEEGSFFEHHLPALVNMMYAIGANVNKLDLDDGVRQYACEVLLGVAESASVMARKSAHFIKHTILVCMSLMLDVEEDPQWGVKEERTDFFDNSNFDCGEQNMDRLALAIKGKKLWPVLGPILDQYVSNRADWRYRHAGLFGLAQSCGALDFKVLPVKDVVRFVKDEHPRVRYAAVQLLGQIPADFEVVTQTRYHAVIFPALMEPLGDFQNPRLQAHAAGALLSMVDGCPGKIVKRYIDGLMARLLSLLKEGHQMVQNQVMPVMAALAGQAPKAFLKYYDAVMPMLMFIIENATSKETRKLRGKAMESASYIGMYVGNAKFHPDAVRIVNLFMDIMKHAAETKAGAAAKAQTSALDDDYSEQYLLDAWTRICSCLKAEFVPILPYVLPGAFEAITRQAEGEFERVHRLVDDSDDPAADDDGEEEDPHVARNGVVKSISTSVPADSSASPDRPNSIYYSSAAHTAAMEEKAHAMGMVCTFCYELREHFLPYVEQTARIFIPLLEHPHDEVKSCALDCMPHLVIASMQAHEKQMTSTEFVKDLLSRIVKQLCECLPGEPDPRILQLVVNCIHDCISEAGPLLRDVLDENSLFVIGDALLRMLARSGNRIEKRTQMLKKEEEKGEVDEERIVEVESMNAAEDGLHTVAAGVITTLIESHGPLFLPVFDRLFPEVQRMLGVNMLDSTKKIAVFIIDDVFEHLGAQAAKYFPHTLAPMCMYACDTNGEHGLRQAAAWGLQLAARLGGPAFQSDRDEIARRLVESLQADPNYLHRQPNEPVGFEWIPSGPDDEGADHPPVDKDGEDADDDGDDDDGHDDGEEADEEDYDAADDRSRHSSLDNMVSALGAIAHYQGRPDLYPVWLGMLPLRVDESEGPHVYNMLLDLVEANHPLVLGDNFANLPKLLSIFLSLVNTSFLRNKDLRARVGKFFQNVKADRKSVV